jgi:hypothetical protein
MSWFYLWVPIEILLALFGAWVSVKNNAQDSLSWFLLTWAAMALPTWPIISKYSKNILFDSMLFDSILIVGYTLAIAYFSEYRFNHYHVAGIVLYLVAFTIFKIGG